METAKPVVTRRVQREPSRPPRFGAREVRPCTPSRFRPNARGNLWSPDANDVPCRLNAIQRRESPLFGMRVRCSRQGTPYLDPDLDGRHDLSFAWVLGGGFRGILDATTKLYF